MGGRGSERRSWHVIETVGIPNMYSTAYLCAGMLAGV